MQGDNLKFGYEQPLALYNVTIKKTNSKNAVYNVLCFPALIKNILNPLDLSELENSLEINIKKSDIGLLIEDQSFRDIIDTEFRSKRSKK